MIIAAIDPGKSNGAMAVLNDTIKLYKMSKIENAYNLVEIFKYYKAIDPEFTVFVEKQSLRKTDDRFIAFALQKLFDNYRMILDSISVTGVNYVEVHPRTWQSVLKLVIKNSKETDKERKNRYKETAQAWFPEVKATAWNQDALLLLEYARRLKKTPYNLSSQRKLFD